MNNDLKIRIERCFKLGRKYYKGSGSKYSLDKFSEAEDKIEEIDYEVGRLMSNIPYIYFNEEITLEQIYQVIDILLGTKLHKGEHK